MGFKINGTEVIDNDGKGKNIKSTDLSAVNDHHYRKDGDNVDDLPSSPEVGEIIYNSSNKQFQVWNGYEWVSFGNSSNQVSGQPNTSTIPETGNLSITTGEPTNVAQEYTPGNGFKYLILKSSAQITVTGQGFVEYIIVGGGGGGGNRGSSNGHGGGGGAGGFNRETVFMSGPFTQPYIIGSGGAGGTSGGYSRLSTPLVDYNSCGGGAGGEGTFPAYPGPTTFDSGTLIPASSPGLPNISGMVVNLPGSNSPTSRSFNGAPGSNCGPPVAFTDGQVHGSGGGGGMTELEQISGGMGDPTPDGAPWFFVGNGGDGGNKAGTSNGGSAAASSGPSNSGGAGGGGGAGGVGTDADSTDTRGGTGGLGIDLSELEFNYYGNGNIPSAYLRIAGGGGGGPNGKGGGGDPNPDFGAGQGNGSSPVPAITSIHADANSGSGGGGAGPTATGGNGGSGVIILRYRAS